MSEEMRKCVEELIKRAKQADKSEDAMRFSQAACNAAGALATLFNIDDMVHQRAK